MICGAAYGHPDIGGMRVEVGPASCPKIFGIVLGVSSFDPHGQPHAVRRGGGAIPPVTREGRREDEVIQAGQCRKPRLLVWSARELLPPPPIQNRTRHFHNIRLLRIESRMLDTSSLLFSDLREVSCCFLIVAVSMVDSLVRQFVGPSSCPWDDVVNFQEVFISFYKVQITPSTPSILLF
jgi:hypothetical protein